MPQKIIPKMRPCVNAAFEQGAQDKDHLSKMRHALVFELNRLGFEKPKIKMALLEWNKKSFKVLSPGDANRQLCDYVDWFFKKECKLSCNALKDYCVLPNGGCAFTLHAFDEEITLPFSILEAALFLDKNYQRDSYLMRALINILFKIQKDNNAKTIIYAGIRSIRDRVLEKTRKNLDLMCILRDINKLEEAGFIRITRGKSGTFGTRHANGYSFLPWKPP